MVARPSPLTRILTAFLNFLYRFKHVLEDHSDLYAFNTSFLNVIVTLGQIIKKIFT